MTSWVKVLNSMPSHPKFVQAGPRASWLFVCGLCYSNEHLTDGFVPSCSLVVVAPGVKNGIALARELVRAGLWTEVAEGWQIHDYDQHQRSSQDVRALRFANAERQRRHRDGRVSNAVTNAVSNAKVTGPEKIREEKISSATPQITRKRATGKVDQTKPPENFPPDLLPRIDAVLPVLHEVWDYRGGIEPMPRGVGLGIQRNLRADHQQVARQLAHWLLAGTGQRAKCKDVTARFGDWTAEAPAAANGRVVAMRRDPALERADAWKGGWERRRQKEEGT